MLKLEAREIAQKLKVLVLSPKGGRPHPHCDTQSVTQVRKDLMSSSGPQEQQVYMQLAL